MAVWIYAYGKNGLITEDNVQVTSYFDILNSIRLDEVKILDSILETEHLSPSIRQHYTDNREKLENHFRSMTTDGYKAYLDLIKQPYIEIDKIIDHFIEEGEKREKQKELQFNFAYDQFKNGQAKSKWELSGNDIFVNNLSYFGTGGGMRVKFLNDLIWITGPSPIFSVYACFLKTISKTSREYYHTYFKKVLRAFKSNFILYAHEWSGLDDEEDEGFNSGKLKEQANWETISSDSIHSMDKFYYEQL